MKSSFLVVAALVAVLSCSFAAATAPDSDRIVVLISVDGLAGFYLDDPKAEMPTLRKMIAEGARSASMKASVPTVTWPNHTTLVTGVHPGRHGVAGNVVLDRATLKPVPLIGDPVLDKDQIVRVPTIYDAAKRAGLSTASVRWPATRNAKTLDWTVPDSSLIAQMETASTPGLLDELRSAGLWKEVDGATGEGKERFVPSDETFTNVFNHIVRKHRPRFAMLHLIDVDHIQHLHGPRTPEAYEAIKGADAHVRQVLDVLHAEFPGRATVVIASDHGFSPIERLVLPNVVLRKAKLLNDADAAGYSKAAVRTVVQGGCTMVYLLDRAKRDETAKAVRDAFAGVEGVARVVMPGETAAFGVGDPADDPHAPDMLLFSVFGQAFGDTAAGDLPFVEKPERKGTHGHDPNLPELHASFVAWGAGIKPGSTLGAVSNTDVTPTLAKLLGVELPGMDGKVLEAALVGGK